MKELINVAGQYSCGVQRFILLQSVQYGFGGQIGFDHVAENQ